MRGLEQDERPQVRRPIQAVVHPFLLECPVADTFLQNGEGVAPHHAPFEQLVGRAGSVHDPITPCDESRSKINHAKSVAEADEAVYAMEVDRIFQLRCTVVQ